MRRQHRCQEHRDEQRQDAEDQEHQDVGDFQPLGRRHFIRHPSKRGPWVRAVGEHVPMVLQVDVVHLSVVSVVLAWKGEPLACGHLATPDSGLRNRHVLLQQLPAIRDVAFVLRETRNGAGLPNEPVLYSRQRAGAMHQLGERRRERGEAGQASIRAEQQEELVVPVAHAVVYPRAVVVHPQHAHLAQQAVVRSLWARQVALLAVSGLARLPLRPRRHDGQSISDGAHKVPPLLGHPAGVREVRSHIAPYRKTPYDVEEDGERQDERLLPHRRQNSPEVDDVVREALVQEHGDAHRHGCLRGAEEGAAGLHWPNSGRLGRPPRSTGLRAPALAA
mmetsp:Transcript_72698/g.201577  ORF Transcript_72698/g.201577 Transcript_72698/m.201577 type:complete len:334 (-) Transcript_72698:44-1045(-)